LRTPFNSCNQLDRADAAFWIDYEYDREMASDGQSRFASYVRRAAATAEWTECWDGTWDDEAVRAMHFASESWHVATTPVMSPGYVRRHPRIRSARVEVNPWDASLAATVEIIILQPANSPSRETAAMAPCGGTGSRTPAAASRST
jgi:hypothetical protein